MRAVARGLALGGLGAALAGWPGLMVGLVAAPLVWIEVWGVRRDRAKTAALLAWAFGSVWLAGVHLEWTFVTALYGTGPERGDLGATFEAVRRELVHVLTVSAADQDDLRGAVFVIGGLIFSAAAAFRLDRWWGAAAGGPLVPAGILLLPFGNTAVSLTFLGAVFWMWVPAIVVVFLYRITDAAVDRVLASTSELDGASDG